MQKKTVSKSFRIVAIHDGIDGENAQYIYLRGTARDIDQDITTSLPAEVRVNGGNSLSTNSRGLNLVTLNRQTLERVDYESYDTYGEAIGLSGKTGITDLVAKLNGLNNTVFVCLVSSDAIGWSDSLITALQGFGMSDLPYTATGRYPFLFLGYKGLGKGNGYTRMNGLGSYQDVVELGAYVAGGAFSVKDGQTGADGKGIFSADIMFCLATSQTTEPADDSFTATSFDDLNITSADAAKYVWQCTKTIYTSGNPTYSGKVCLGKVSEFASIIEQYALGTASAATSTWQDNTPPQPQKGSYLWTRTKLTYAGGGETYSPSQAGICLGYYGMDGTSPYFADMDNEMESIACAYNGHIDGLQEVYTNVSMFYGTTPLTPTITVYDEIEDENNRYENGIELDGITVTINNGQIEISFEDDTDLSAYTKKEFLIKLVASGQTRYLTFTVNLIRAARNGEHATLYSLIPSANVITKDASGTPTFNTLNFDVIKRVGTTETTISIVSAFRSTGLKLYYKSGATEVDVDQNSYWSGSDLINYHNIQTLYANVDKVEWILRNSSGQMLDKEGIGSVKNGAGQPSYMQTQEAWSNEEESDGVYIMPSDCTELSWNDITPTNYNNKPYLWRRSRKMVLQNDGTYAVATGTDGRWKYARLSGTNGTSIRVNGTVVAVEEYISDFPTTGLSNGDLAIENQTGSNTLYKWSSSTGEWVDDGPIATDGDAYVNRNDGHLWMWSAEAEQWIDLGQFQGQSGITYYTHIAWASGVTLADNEHPVPSGHTTTGQTTTPNATSVTGFSIAPFDGASWMGVLVNTISNDTTDGMAYTWNKVKGQQGNPGGNTATVFLYRRSSAAVGSDVKPTGTLWYKFADKKLYTLSGTTYTEVQDGAAILNGWHRDIPSGTDPIYIISAIAFSSEEYDNIATNEWVGPVQFTENGKNGINTAPVFLYKRATSLPDDTNSNYKCPQQTLYYKFADGQLYTKSGSTYTLVNDGAEVLKGWHLNIPSSDGNPCYVIQAAALSTEDYDAIEVVNNGSTYTKKDWSDVRKLVEDGAQGPATIHYSLEASINNVHWGDDYAGTSKTFTPTLFNLKLTKYVGNTATVLSTLPNGYYLYYYGYNGDTLKKSGSDTLGAHNVSNYFCYTENQNTFVCDKLECILCTDSTKPASPANAHNVIGDVVVTSTRDIYRMLIPAGTYQSQLYTRDDSTTPLVYDQTSGFYWYLDADSNQTSQGYEAPSNASTCWKRATNNFQVILTQMLFTEFARMGGFIVYNNFFISQYGTLVGNNTEDIKVNAANVNTLYTANKGGVSFTSVPYGWFDGNDPMGETATSGTTYKFRPMKVVNALTGEEWMAEGKVHVDADGSVSMVNVNVEGVIRANLLYQSFLRIQPDVYDENSQLKPGCSDNDQYHMAQLYSAQALVADCGGVLPNILVFHDTVDSMNEVPTAGITTDELERGYFTKELQLPSASDWQGMSITIYVQGKIKTSDNRYFRNFKLSVKNDEGIYTIFGGHNDNTIQQFYCHDLYVYQTSWNKVPMWSVKLISALRNTYYDRYEWRWTVLEMSENTNLVTQ